MNDTLRESLSALMDGEASDFELRKILSGMRTDYRSNITNAEKDVKFTKAELEGVPDGYLNADGIKTGDDEYTVQANVTYHFLVVMEPSV